MSVVAPIIASFNAGEISPMLDARTDQNVRSIAVKKMWGWVPTLQGPAVAAPGTLFVAAAKGPNKLIPFEYNETQGYVIEAGEVYMRFYTNDARIETSPGVAYELVAPFTFAQLQTVEWDQSLDVLYMAHGSVPTRALVRTSADTFAFNMLELRNGPWESRNADESLTISASGTTGSVTISASASIFAAGDVGGLMEIEYSDFSAVKSWEPGMQITSSALIQWGGRVYQHVGGNLRTGSVAPIHIEGDRWDGQNGQDINAKGPYGCIWRYLYDRFGQVRFTAFTDASTMTATVERRLAATSPSWRWRFGAFSDRRGWPHHICIWQDRLCLFKDFSAHLSAVGGYGPDYADFSLRNELGDLSRDMAFTVVLPNPSKIRWVLADRDLIIGTGKGEHVITAASAGAGIGPGNADVTEPGSNGSANGRAVKVGPRAVYVQRARAKLLQMGYDGNRLLQQESEDLTRFADHIGARGLRDPVWQKEPHRLIWLRCDDGTAAGVAFNPDEQLLGWFNRRFANGLLLTSHTSISDPDGRFDQMWFGVQSSASHWVLLQAPFRASTDASLDKVMSDASVVIDGSASTSISAPHLAGKTVEVIADGKVHSNVTLDSNGNGNLTDAAAKKIVGLSFEAEMELLSIEAGSDNGSAQNKLGRVHRTDISLLNSDGVEIEVQGKSTKIELQQGDSPLDSAFALFTGYKEIPTIGNWQRSETIRIRRYLPKPATVRAVILHLQKSST
jgi:hypothetical protein